MPTFASIGFHPALRSRLVVPTGNSNNINYGTARQKNSSSTTGTTTAAVSMGATNQITQKQQLRPLETPYSLLLHEDWRLTIHEEAGNSSATNASTTTTRPVAQHEINALRRQVASSMIYQTKCGKRQRTIRQERQQDEENCNSNNNSSKRRRVRLDGFLSMAELVAYETTTLVKPLCSGHEGLDQFVADDTFCPNPATTGDVPVGLTWGNHVVQLSGGPGVGKTQLALQWALSAAATTATPAPSIADTDVPDSTTPSCRILYLVPAHASVMPLARRLADLQQQQTSFNPVDTNILSRIVLDSFRDEQELSIILAQFEEQIALSAGKDEPPWLLIIDGYGTAQTQQPQTKRWKRLLRLYKNGMVIVVTSITTSSFGTIHLRLLNSLGHVQCIQHVQRDKVGAIVSLYPERELLQQE